MPKIKECSGYSDKNGNHIIGNVKNCEIMFTGKNSVLTIGKNFHAENMKIRISSNCKIEIGNNITAIDSSWNFYDNAYCKIGADSRFSDNGFLSVCPYAQIVIGKGFTTEFDYIMIALPYTEIRFGDDCMISRRVSVQSNDGHDIFDVKTGQNTNATEEIARTRKIIVGNHVWIGQGATVLYNTNICDGSIVGTKSLVKGVFPNNCIIAGNPARLIRKDIAWSRNLGDMDINVIDNKFVNFTEFDYDTNKKSSI